MFTHSLASVTCFASKYFLSQSIPKIDGGRGFAPYLTGELLPLLPRLPSWIWGRVLGRNSGKRRKERKGEEERGDDEGSCCKGLGIQVLLVSRFICCA